ncbi:nitrilase-related carbon-nitrogen hydrolase [Defluviimonas sp. D31]|uniref:nitrilase-related carbon-nitrogen hydrolase n=1 Tax=Defluviimonas sp. D31 TaxID=3083253 RepID=UPI00296F7704|nr:nitrilase-related carbon-nitrogen hydrolase [Defluviimonas sp. D31]MDW4550048.1 nitrilase-related carbon-nitrogen hydrolase [Defluviimonas sp. D31]
MSTAQKIKVGAAQFSSEIGDVDANIDRHLHWIARGHEAGLDFLVLPELSLTGHYGPDRLLTAAMTRTDPRLMQLAEAAGPMAVSVGFIEEGPAAQFYNAAAVLKDGKLLHLHRKVNLPTYGKLEEGKHYASGRFVETFSLAGRWTAGLLICADVWNPALTHLAFLQGATLLTCPVSSGIEAVGADFDNPAGWALTCRFYAMMYGAPVIMANRTGTERDLHFWGGSRIIDPFGKELAVAGAEAELITAELDYDVVRHARHLLPTVRDSNIALVLRETQRLVETLGIPDFVRENH